MLDRSRLVGSSVTQHHVKAARPMAQPVLGQILSGKPYETSLLALIHRISRPSVRGGAPPFHFDKDQDVTRFSHEVKFTRRKPKISGEDPIPFPTQKAFRFCLSCVAKDLAPMWHGHTLSRYRKRSESPKSVTRWVVTRPRPLTLFSRVFLPDNAVRSLRGCPFGRLQHWPKAATVNYAGAMPVEQIQVLGSGVPLVHNEIVKGV
jgi:hypothetical protein